MGVSSSVLRDLPAEKQFEIFQILRKHYGDSTDDDKPSNYEEYLLWKSRLESHLSGQTSYSSLDHKEKELLRIVDSRNHLSVGDIVRAKTANGQLTPEGLILAIIGGTTADIDFGDAIQQYPLESCTLVLSGLDYEVDDHVQVKPLGMALYFTGVVIAVHVNSASGNVTMDVKMAGDDPDDIEYGVPPERVMKLNSGRLLARAHWMTLKNVMQVSNVLRQVSPCEIK